MSRPYRIEPMTMLSRLFKKRTQRMPYYYVKKFFKLLEKRHVVYPLAVFLLVLVLSGHILSLQGKQITFIENEHVAATTAANVSDFFLTASIVIVVLYMPKNSEDFFQFFSKLYPEGNQLFGPLLAIKKTHFWRNFLICNLCIGSLVSFNASFFMVHFGWAVYKFVIFGDLEFYFYNLLLLLLLALARKLEMRFAELNELLEYKTEHFLKTSSKSKTLDTADLDNKLSFILNSEHFYSVRTFRTMHYDLCRLVKRFNEMFGRIILSMIVFSIANILAKVTFIIDYYVTPRSEEEKHKWSLFVAIVCAWIFANLGQAFLFSYYGEQITKEGEKTTRTCFYLLNKVPFQTKNEDEQLVQDELKLFALQSYSNIPCLSAGGFFDVNFRVLGLMISSVTSYLMVIIQFLLRPPTS